MVFFAVLLQFFIEILQNPFQVLFNLLDFLLGLTCEARSLGGNQFPAIAKICLTKGLLMIFLSAGNFIPFSSIKANK